MEFVVRLHSFITGVMCMLAQVMLPISLCTLQAVLCHSAADSGVQLMLLAGTCQCGCPGWSTLITKQLLAACLQPQDLEFPDGPPIPIIGYVSETDEASKLAAEIVKQASGKAVQVGCLDPMSWLSN